MAVERERLKGLLPLQHQIDGRAGGGQRRIGQRPLGKDRRIARRDREHVAFAHRHLELLGKVQQHVAARLRAPGFDEAQMPRGDAGVAGELELAQAPALAPFA